MSTFRRRLLCSQLGDRYIIFADPNVETICLNQWDTDHDGKLSTREAAVVTTLPNNIFNGNTSIVSFDELQYFRNLTTIAAKSISGCTSLSSITFPNSLTEIDKYAFYGCTGLTTCIIPTSVTTIKASAFTGCSSLTGVLDLPNLTLLEIASFNATKITRINSLGSITAIRGGGSTNGTFSKCKSLTSVILPNTLTTIGAYAFYQCIALTACTIPSSVTTIGSYAFNGCSSLTGVLDLPNLTSLAVSSFINTSITRIDDLGSVTSIPGGSANSGCFRGCDSLTSVTLPSTLTDIKAQAFGYCTSLTTVTCLATTPPTIDSNSFVGCSALAHIYVPAASVSAYQSSWSAYSGIISAI